MYTRKSALNWDVQDGIPENGEISDVIERTDYPPVIIDIVPDSALVVGENDLTCIYEDKDNKITELAFDWRVVTGNASITADLDRAVLTMNGVGSAEVEVTITDVHGNHTSAQKIFII